MGDLGDGWRAKGKKVIISFGGAGMGGSWSGDSNNCWDYCFGKEEQLSTDLTSIIADQNFDGIDIDYEYCYDVAGKQSGKCPQRAELLGLAHLQSQNQVGRPPSGQRLRSRAVRSDPRPDGQRPRARLAVLPDFEGAPRRFGLPHASILQRGDEARR